MKRSALGAVLAGALAIGMSASALAQAPDVDAVVDRQYSEALQTMPQVVSLLGLPGAEQANHQLNNVALSQRAPMRRMLAGYLTELEAFDRTTLTGQQRWTWDTAAWMYERQLELASPDWAVAWLPLSGAYAVDHLFGIPTTLPQFLSEQHAITSPDDADAYISRLQAVGTQLDQVIDNLDLQAEQGVVPPRVSLESLATQIRTLLAPASADSLFVTSMARRLDAVDGLDADIRSGLLDRATEAVEQSVNAGYSRLLARVETLLESQQDNHGVWSLPGGDSWYDAALRWNTSTDLGADEIHQIGLSEVARLEKEMDAILRGQGLAAGSITDRVQALQTDPTHTYSDDETGRAQVLADIRAALDRIDPHLDTWFSQRPDAPLEVQPVPAYAEDSAPGGYYYPPALDGSRPGVFFINLGKMEHARWALPTLAYHEGAPGHHFQIALGQSLTDLPLMRRTLNPSAFTEGWALYAEQVAAEMGVYEDDPLGELGRLQAEMFRAVRLVVDTGLHRKRWSRGQAMDYMGDKTGLSAQDVRIEIDRYLVQPGQACSYKIGHLRMAQLRERANEALGEGFDVRAFHDLVLGNGALPLAVLENAVDEWIATQTP
ncbi:DUF885 domain-containing protein [Luteimonas sp. MJ293]|uniref:DUF885 domain-containing protein n=1 Tax=Luteimonas sp. MJ146 TaxID=3129240 RepID=UPI0031BBC7CF